MASQRWAGPLSAAISQSDSRASTRTADRAPNISAARAVRRRANSLVPRDGFSSRVVAENWASRLSEEPSRRVETSALRFTARIEDWGLARDFSLRKRRYGPISF